MADCYLFMAGRKTDAVAAILLFISGIEVHSLSGVWNGWEKLQI